VAGEARAKAKEDGRSVEVAGREILVTRPDKVYFPALDATKFDLVSYYLDIGEHLLNTAGGRPALLQRFPEGAGGKSFFQKRIPAGAPPWLQSTVVSTPNGTTSNALVVADLAHVVWAVNYGCLGLHLWPYLAADPDHADELRIDLDPTTGIGFEEVRVAALLTGSHGLHVYLRLEPRWDSIEVRAAALALARELERRHPRQITASWWKEERGSRVFVDFNQNAPHKTVFGAWFARPRVGGQVSTPLSWDEVETVVPDELTIRSVPDLVRRRGDPWADIARAPQSIEPLLAMAAADRDAGLLDAPWPPQYPKMPDEPTRVAPSRAKKVEGEAQGEGE
jgi:DNA ligase D-like protein (predicted polymerase)